MACLAVTAFRNLRPIYLVAYAQQWTGVLCSFVIMRWIPPEQLGIWNTFLIIDAYLAVLRLGVINALNREYPYLLGRGETDAAIDVVRVTEAHTLAIAAVSGACMLVATIILAGRGADWRWIGSSFVVWTPATLFQAFLEATYRGKLDFNRLAVVQAVSIALQLATLPLVARFGLGGFAIRQVATVSVVLATCYTLRPVKAGPKRNMGVLRELLRTGMPLFASNYITKFGANLGPTAALIVGGQLTVGLFAPVASISNLFANLPSVFSVYFLTHKNFEFGKTGDRAAVVRQATHMGLALTAAVLPIAIVGCLLLPFAVHLWCPKYTAATVGMQIAALAGALRCFSVAATCFSTLKAWRAMFANLGWTVGALALGIAGCLAAAPHHPIEAIAGGVLLGSVLGVVATLWNLRTLSADPSKTGCPTNANGVSERAS